jgi:hypothetical protein
MMRTFVAWSSQVTVASAARWIVGSMYMGPKGIDESSMCLIPTIFPEVREKKKLLHML